jgi:hypothetical protein
MTARRRSAAAWLPPIIVIVLAACSVLPLRWTTLITATTLVGALTAAAARRRSGGSTLAAAALALVTSFIVSYAAYELVHPGALGGGRRLAYPFLIATGLRVEGGAWLLLLCAAVSVVPLLLRDRTPGTG